MKTIKIPTGYLFIQDYKNYQLETLSIGDYGKAKNVKADFLGLSKPLNGVSNGICEPIQSKWVITVSTQRGCSQSCVFCSCPNIPFRGNCSFDDLFSQFKNARNLFPNVKYSERLNLHFARCGEPIFNKAVFKFAEYLHQNKRQLQEELDLRIEVLHPVLTTSLPNYLNDLESRILQWCEIKNEMYNGQAGLQFSINSTDEDQRQYMFSNKVITLEQLSKIGERLPEPVGRKYCLNFAYASTFKIDGSRLKSLFDSNKFMIKITPIHNNKECRKNGIETVDGYSSYAPYESVEQNLKDNGFDVLVFVPSMDEEKGAVTCGNLILGGDRVSTNNEQQIEGI